MIWKSISNIYIYISKKKNKLSNVSKRRTYFFKPSGSVGDIGPKNTLSNSLISGATYSKVVVCTETFIDIYLGI